MLHIFENLFMASSLDKCHTDLANFNFLYMCDYLGVPIAHKKTVEPRTTIELAGITINCISQEAKLPPDKLQKNVTSCFINSTSVEQLPFWSFSQLPPSCNSTPMWQSRKVMARFLVLVGFMARGLDRGVPFMSLVSNSF